MKNVTITVVEKDWEAFKQLYAVENFSEWVREQMAAAIYRFDATMPAYLCGECGHRETAFFWKRISHGICPNCKKDINSEQPGQMWLKKVI
jgi:uncharacterized CHY-type Zn-finger protein